MKKLLIPLIALALASPAWSAQQNISTITTKASREALRGAVNTELGKVQSNTTELYSLAIAAPWLAQTTAPSITNVFWVDTSGTSPVIKYHNGSAWVAASSGEGGTYTLPTASADTLGGVKVGARLTITDGVLSADVQSGTGAVDSVNTKTGTVVLNPDDLVDTATTNKFVTSAQKALLDGANQFKLAGPSVGVNGPTYLQGGAAAIGGVLFRFPIDLPSSGTDLMTLASSTGQMGHTPQSTFLTPSGVGGALTVTATGFDGNLATTDNTIQEIAQKFDDYTGGGSMTWPAAAGIMVYGGSSAFGTSLVADGDAIGEVVVVHDDGSSNPVLPFTIDLADLTAASLTGNSKYYGTNSSGVRGVYDLPTSGSTNLDGLTDVVVSGTPTTDYVLKYNGTSWVPAADATAAGAGYVSTPPTYSDEACTAGQYSLDESYRYDCVASGNWNRTGLTNWTNLTPTDTIPDAFSFTDVTNATISTAYTDVKQITGIDAGITCTGSGGTVAACTGSTEGTCGTFGGTSGTITNNQYVGARITSSGSASTAVNNVVTCGTGSTSDTFTVTTGAGTVDFTGAPGSTETFESGAGAFITGTDFAETDPQSIINTYSTTQYKNGTHSAYLGFAGSEAGLNFIRADIETPDTNFTLSYWIRAETLPAWNNELVSTLSQHATAPYNASDNALTTMISDQDGGSNFKVRIYDYTSGTSVLGTINYPINAWIKFVYSFRSGGSSDLKIYNASNVLQETITIATSPTRSIQYFYWGEVTSSPQTTIRPFYIDDVQYNSTNP